MPDPLQSLPPEVVSLILVWALPVQPSSTVFESYITPKKPTPLVLSAVCQRWRSIAMATPELWNIISIPFTKRTSRSPDYLQLIQDWLQRSKQLPLYLRLEYTGDENEDILALPNNIFDAVNHHAARWKVLNLILPGMLLNRFRSSTEQTMLDVYYHAPPSGTLEASGMNENDPAGFNLGLAVPQPTRVKVHVLNVDLLKIGWSKVNHLSATFSSWKHSMAVFRGSPNLAHCYLSMLTDNDVDEALSASNGAPLSLKSLEHLQTTYVSRLFADHLITPSLKSLICEGNFRYLTRFIRQSRCPLVHLHLYDIYGALDDTTPLSDQILEFLRLVPTLETLHLADANIDRHVFETLGNTADWRQDREPMGRLLPYLRELKFTGIRTIPWSFFPLLVPSSLIGSGAQSKAAPGLSSRQQRPLSRVTLDFYMTDDDLDDDKFISETTLRQLADMVVYQKVDLSIRHEDKDMIDLSLRCHFMDRPLTKNAQVLD